MRMSIKIISGMLAAFFLFTLSAETKLKPRLGEPPLRNDSYIFIDGNTPDYIIKNAEKKRIGFAFHLKSESGEWLMRNLKSIVKNNPVVFIESRLDKQEKKYLDDLAKLSEYSLKIICFSGDCEKSDEWKHSLIKSSYIVEWKKTAKSEELILKGLKKTSKGELLSAVDMKSFRNLPLVNGAVFFREHRFAFVSIDENERPEFMKEADTVIYFSKSEKKLKEFIEKKN